MRPGGPRRSSAIDQMSGSMPSRPDFRVSVDQIWKRQGRSNPARGAVARTVDLVPPVSYFYNISNRKHILERGGQMYLVSLECNDGTCYWWTPQSTFDGFFWTFLANFSQWMTAYPFLRICRQHRHMIGTRRHLLKNCNAAANA